MDFIDSKTYQNLIDAYNNELIKIATYDIYGMIARDEQFIEVANIYGVFSRNSVEHARIWLRLMNGGILPKTIENLRVSIDEINPNRYSEFAAIAKEEGYEDIAGLFSGVGIIHANHDLVFETLANEIETNQMFCKNTEELWLCQACGNIMAGTCAPEICPVCGFPQGYYKVYDCIA